MFGIEQRAARAARRAGLISAGVLLCSCGVVFLTVAGWLALLPIVGAAQTATIFALLYLGVGALLMGFASRSEQHSPKSHPAKSEETPPTEGPPIMQAFMYGLQAGAQSKSQPKSQSRH